MTKQRPTAPASGTDDAEAFRAAVRDVTPLASAPVVAGLVRPKPRVRLRKAAAAAAAADLDASMPLASSADAVTGDAALSFQRAGVRLQVMRRLRRGLYPLDDEVDLHGLTQTAARSELADFIATALRDVRLPVSGGDLLCSACELFDRARDPCGDPETADDGEEDAPSRNSVCDGADVLLGFDHAAA